MERSQAAKPHCTSPSHTTDSVELYHDLQVETVQCRGVHTSAIDITTHLPTSPEQGRHPQILILTETKLKQTLANRPPACIRNMLQGYKAWHSTHPEQKHPQAGVSMAIEQVLVDMNEATVLPNHTPPELHG